MDKSMCVSQDCPRKEECGRHTTSPHLYTEIAIFNWSDVDGFVCCPDFVDREFSEEEYLKKGLKNVGKFVDKMKQIFPDDK